VLYGGFPILLLIAGRVSPQFNCEPLDAHARYTALLNGSPKNGGKRTFAKHHEWPWVCSACLNRIMCLFQISSTYLTFFKSRRLFFPFSRVVLSVYLISRSKYRLSILTHIKNNAIYFHLRQNNPPKLKTPHYLHALFLSDTQTSSV
jgi:hypothetical protein